MQHHVTLQQQVVVDGRVWRLFAIDFDTADGPSSTYVYGLSFEHAAAIVQELRDSARLGGQLEGAVPA